MVPWRIVTSLVKKMVDLDTSRMCGLAWTKFLVVFEKKKKKLSHVLETPILSTKKKIGILFGPHINV